MRSLLFFLLLLSYPLAASAEPDGAELFGKHCVKCHGEGAKGTDKGPPLVNKIYHPNHHADLSFRWAIERGVRAHHWKFGDMPKVEGVSSSEIDALIKYIRGLQKAAGIF